MSGTPENNQPDGRPPEPGGYRAKLNPIASALTGGGTTRSQRILLGALLDIAVILPFLVDSNRWITLMNVVVFYVVLA